MINENLTDLLKVTVTTTAPVSLITAERASKLELLTHLLENSPEAIVVCGSKGVGKTTLLKILQGQHHEAWLYCELVSTAELTFSLFQKHLAQFLKQNPAKTDVKSLTGMLQQLKSQHKKLLLLIDDAGNMPPGLITSIIEYLATKPMLRVVFVLSHDEFSLKTNSDQLIDVCHFIEIPPLSEKQCGDFLGFLATSTRSKLSYKAINEQMIKTIYLETHGIPGKIIEQLPELVSTHASEKSLWMLLPAILVLIAIALSGQWFENSKKFVSENFATKTTPVKPTDAKAVSSELNVPPVIPNQ